MKLLSQPEPQFHLAQSGKSESTILLLFIFATLPQSIKESWKFSSKQNQKRFFIFTARKMYADIYKPNSNKVNIENTASVTLLFSMIGFRDIICIAIVGVYFKANQFLRT